MKYFRVPLSLLLLGLLLSPLQLHANVFASHIRITQQGSNSSFDGNFKDGTGIWIRFVLSDHADSVVAVIKNGGTEVRNFTTTNLNKGDTSVAWDGKDNSGAYISEGTYSYTVELTTYDKGYSSFTTLYDESHGIFTRGVTSIKNPALKNFGFIYTADNGGYSGAGTAVMRHAADGSQWGNTKGAAKLTTTGNPINGTLRFSSEADEDGYVYLLNTNTAPTSQVHRYHTDTLNITMIDSGGYSSIVRGIGIRGTGSGRYLAIAGDNKVYGFHLGNNTQHFGAKDTILLADSTLIFYDVAFGRDSMMYVVYYYTSNTIGGKSGVAKFDLTGYTGTPLKLSNAVWQATADTGRVITLAYHKSSSGVSSDIIYFVRNQTFGLSGSTVGVYAITDIDGATPTITQAYIDGTGGNSTARADVAVDAVGNAIHFENSTENVAIISPPTGPNNFTTAGSLSFKVVNSIPIKQAIVDANGDFKPDSLGKTVTVAGVVNSVNTQTTNFQYTIQDDSAGIMIFKSGLAGAPSLNRGYRVVVTGVIEQFNGTTEIVPANYSDIVILDTGNVLTPIPVTIKELVSNGEEYESRFIKINGIAKTASSAAWPATGQSPNMTFYDGWDTITVRIDSDTEIDGSPEPAYPVNVQGVAGQFSSLVIPNNGYQVIPMFISDITAGVQVPPNPHFALATPANGATIKLDSVTQSIVFSWKRAVDLNGDNLIYQWAPVGFTAVTTGAAGADSFLVRTGAQLRTLMAGSDTTILKWTARTKDPANPIVTSVDTATIILVKGLITGVESAESMPLVYSLAQNYPNPFNPSTTIEYSIPNDNFVTLKIYNTLGQEVVTLVNENLNAGRYSVSFNANAMASGIYFYRIEAGTFVSVKKMMLLK